MKDVGFTFEDGICHLTPRGHHTKPEYWCSESEEPEGFGEYE
jgi:hypothetical protein